MSASHKTKDYESGDTMNAGYVKLLYLAFIHLTIVSENLINITCSGQIV